MNALAPYIGPFLALLGTLIVAAIGFYQWRRTATNQSRSAVAEARRKAAEALWSKLEEANIALRSGQSLNEASLRALHNEVNSTFLKNSLYLTEETHRLVSAYLNSLIRVSSMLRGSNSLAAEEWTNTTWPVAQQPGVLAEALAEAERQRSAVKRVLLELTGA
jgi:hypothetical protein